MVLRHLGVKLDSVETISRYLGVVYVVDHIVVPCAPNNNLLLNSSKTNTIYINIKKLKGP